MCKMKHESEWLICVILTEHQAGLNSCLQPRCCRAYIAFCCITVTFIITAIIQNSLQEYVAWCAPQALNQDLCCFNIQHACYWRVQSGYTEFCNMSDSYQNVLRNLFSCHSPHQTCNLLTLECVRQWHLNKFPSSFKDICNCFMNGDQTNTYIKYCDETIRMLQRPW